MNEQRFLEDLYITITKPTFDRFLKQENPSDLLSLYSFYYYTSKWQGTNRPKCTTSYAANGLRWSEARVRKVKKQLINLGLVEDVKTIGADGRISGHYIRVIYLLTADTENRIYAKDNHTVENPTGWETPQGGEGHRLGDFETNALSAGNLNALSAGNLNALSAGNLNALSAGNEMREKKRPTRHKYGQYNNVLLSDDDMEKLKAEFPNDYEERIERLSGYIASSGKSYKNHLATIRNWAKRDKEKVRQEKDTKNSKWNTSKPIEYDDLNDLF